MKTMPFVCGFTATDLHWACRVPLHERGLAAARDSASAACALWAPNASVQHAMLPFSLGLFTVTTLLFVICHCNHRVMACLSCLFVMRKEQFAQTWHERPGHRFDLMSGSPA